VQALAAGLVSVDDAGAVVRIDDVRTSVAGMLNPRTAGALTVGEGLDNPAAALCRLQDGRSLSLWPGLDSFMPHAATDGTRYFVATWGSGRVRLAIVTEADFSAVPPVTIPRFSHPMKVGYFYRDTSAIQYGGDNPAAPCNVSVIIDPLALPAEDYNGKPVGMILDPACLWTLVDHPEWWPRVEAVYLTAEGDAGMLERKAQVVRWLITQLGLSAKPMLSYTAGSVFPRALDPQDIIGVQLYLTGNQGPNDLRELAASLLPQVQHRRVALICQAYDRAGAYTGDLAALQPVYAEIAEAWPNCEYVLWFSDGRKGGVRDHENIRPWHLATLAACG
jgi:hypothetical protein